MTDWEVFWLTVDLAAHLYLLGMTVWYFSLSGDDPIPGKGPEVAIWYLGWRYRLGYLMLIAVVCLYVEWRVERMSTSST